MQQRRLKSRLGQLALAVLNATLLLAVLLVFGLWLLFGRVQGFATDTARAAAAAMGETLDDRANGLAATLDSLSTLDTRISAAIAGAGSTDRPALAELSALRADVQGLTAAVGALNAAATGLRAQPVTAISDTLHLILLDLAARLGPASPPTPPAN